MKYWIDRDWFLCMSMVGRKLFSTTNTWIRITVHFLWHLNRFRFGFTSMAKIILTTYWIVGWKLNFTTPLIHKTNKCNSWYSLSCMRTWRYSLVGWKLFSTTNTWIRKTVNLLWHLSRFWFGFMSMATIILTIFCSIVGWKLNSTTLLIHKTNKFTSKYFFFMRTWREWKRWCGRQYTTHSLKEKKKIIHCW